VKNRATLETQARLHMRRNDFANALAFLDQALRNDKNAQSLWLLRADCAYALNRWPAQAESLERALELGPAPLDRTTEIVAGYFAAGQPERALRHLWAVTGKLPLDAGIRAKYAGFWEQLRDPAAAENLWKSALEADAKFEPACAGLAQHYLDERRPADALRVAGAGLDAAPASLRLLLAKESALESLGDVYAARRLLNQRAKTAGQIEFLKRRAHLEDYYGAAGAGAYLALLNALIDTQSPQIEIVETCRRGLLVALRTESFDAAKTFAWKLAAASDRSGLDLLERKKSSVDSRTEILGGSDALHFLMLGSAQSKPDRILIDYSRALNAVASDSAVSVLKAKWQRTGAVVHEYFTRLAALAALGSRKPDRVEILLSLKNKADKQRTEKVLGILGLKLKNGKGGVTVESAEGKSQVKKQDTLAALAIDQEGIQETLAAGKSYTLKIEIDSVPVFPAVDLWQKGFYEHDRYPGGFVEALVSDTRLPQLYLALNSMDRAAAEALVAAVPLRTLADRFSAALSMFSAALAMSGSRAEVPGGPGADAVWRQLAGVGPDKAVPFFEALLSKDDGGLIAFFYTLSEIDPAHQRFFTRTPARAKRFYDLFRESSEMRRGGEHRLGSDSFVQFLRGVPLNDDGSVDFPGSPEVWMVAKGHNAAGASVARMTRKVKRAAAPDDEDEILIRLAGTGYKAEHREQSELANFIAVSRIDAERDEPMDTDSALLLAQGYASFGGLYPYFTELGDLEVADYRTAFSVATKIAALDVVTANTLLGEWHSFLAMLATLHESGLVQPKDVVELYRKAAARFVSANNEADWAVASLNAIDDLASRAAPGLPSRDAAIRSLLLGTAHRDKAYGQLLALQKVPSLDALFAIWIAVTKARDHPAGLDEAQRALSTFSVLTPPKAWKLEGDRKKNLERYQTAEAQAILLKLRAALAKRKRNQNEIGKLSTELMAALDPWIELAMAGPIYARYLDPTDLLPSEDPMLLRKHEFVGLTVRNGKPMWFTPANLSVSSEDEGSYFTGGLAEFSLAAGRARAAGNHLGGSGGEAFAAAVLASVRATDWRGVTAAGLASFGASVRLAREWIVESAASPPMRRELEQDARGLLSLTRRKALLEALDRRDWPAVWQSVSVSDLHFLGDAVARLAPEDLWSSPVLAAMKRSSAHPRELDVLGSVAPDLSGCAQTRLRRYEPYEEYQRHAFPDRLAERLAELKLYLAWLADQSAWPPDSLSRLASPVADALLSKLAMRDMWDWDGALDSFRGLKAENLELLLNHE
jgi:tetratricopeptide (TPR) repeat protein